MYESYTKCTKSYTLPRKLISRRPSHGLSITVLVCRVHVYCVLCFFVYNVEKILSFIHKNMKIECFQAKFKAFFTKKNLLLFVGRKSKKKRSKPIKKFERLVHNQIYRRYLRIDLFPFFVTFSKFIKIPWLFATKWQKSGLKSVHFCVFLTILAIFGCV